jgi:ubiquitin carboxyl-terminal hydrolase 7
MPVLTVPQEVFEILVPKSGSVEDIIAALIKKAQLEAEATAGLIRVYEIHSNKIHRELNRENDVVSITDYIQLVAERVPDEDLDVDANMFIQAFHYHNDPNKTHGTPFKFRIIEVSSRTTSRLNRHSNSEQGEKFSDTKKRLEKRTGIKGKNFDKIKFAVVKRSTYVKPTYLTDGMYPTRSRGVPTDIPRR